jgi:hypothetical protein
VHRDLKPENVFIVGAGTNAIPTAKLLDFGISKSFAYDFFDQQRLTSTGMVMGTPYYMAPEQARGDSNLDQRVDLWAVGVIIYEALSGRRPFVATNYNALLVKILTSRPRSLARMGCGAHPAVIALVDRALAKLREDRFQNARSFIEAIDSARRATMAEDGMRPAAAVRRRPPPPRVRPPAALPRDHSGEDWSDVIDDPETFVDDDRASLAGALASVAATRVDAPPPLREVELLLEPLEPTVRDVARGPRGRAREASAGAAREGQQEEDGDDTEIMVRSTPRAVPAPAKRVGTEHATPAPEAGAPPDSITVIRSE